MEGGAPGKREGECQVLGGQGDGQSGSGQQLPLVGTMGAQMRKVRGGCSRY